MTQRSEVGRSVDAITLIQSEQGMIRALLLEFDSIRHSREFEARQCDLAEEIGERVGMLGRIEAEMLYPAARAVLAADELLDEAEAQHVGIGDLVQQLHALYPGDDFFRATISVLGEEFEQHAALEEELLFPLLRQTGLDLCELGARLQARRHELDIAFLPPHEHDQQAGKPD